MAGYLFSNKKLRDELSKAKDPEEAAKSLAKHLQKDGKMLAGEMQKFIESDDVQSNITKAKKFAKGKADQAKKELKEAVNCGKKKAVKAGKTATKKAKKTAKKTVRKVKAKTRKLM
ncbi:MAG: hypothetical protein KAS32_26575 [Candidatus Peribacteraceae bacterium]|nr:hypothetical protein [Candidatus Peribacteraceae bacterium]